MTTIPIFTVGYGDRPVADLIALLQKHEIAYVIDVRSQPYSRTRPDYSQAQLRQSVRQAGMRYVFMGQTLGGRPEEPACYANGMPDYEQMARQPAFQHGLDRLASAHSQQLRVALLCAEKQPERCHRSRLIAPALLERGIDVAHIDENGMLLAQPELEVRLDADQPVLFAGEAAGNGAAPQIATLDDARSVLKRVFGFDDFRALQNDIVDNVLQKRDTLAIMPTGSGKSLCYQLPALLFSGLTVVVSPLISLMQDQVDQLLQYGINAVTLNSSLPYSTYLDHLVAIRRGEVALLYVAPETLLKPDIGQLLREVTVDCLAIDEAHCISQWGHDFRPEYRQLMEVRRRLPGAVCLAVTATATNRVRADIIQALDIPEADTFIASFDRPNLFLKVEPRLDSWSQIADFLEKHRGESGIIYCSTRAQVNDLAIALQNGGWSARPYHAGLDDETRRQNQRDFVRDDVDIIVATVAFGMGIDKADVRFVIHHNLPKNIEHYYQEIGRAGRDGQPADCLLLYSAADIHTIRHFIREQAPTQRAGAEARLQGLLSFAESSECRRRPLLAYFGETYGADSCDRCDNCVVDETDQVDISEYARHFLNCVAHTGQMFGAGHIIRILRGSRARKVVQQRHDRLPVYGAGADLSKKQWQLLAHQFVQQDLLQRDRQHGSLLLTPTGRQVLEGAQVFGTLDRPAATRPAAADIPVDVGLLTRLRELRKELADQQNVPPYVIFHDRSLEEMAARRPTRRETFGNIYGVGEAKLERFGQPFMALITVYSQERDLSCDVGTAGRRPSPPSKIGNRTTQLAEAFASAPELGALAAAEGIKESTVVDHLWRYVRDGGTLPAAPLREYAGLAPEVEKQVVAAFRREGTDLLRPVFDALEGAVAYEQLKLIRIVLVSEENKVGQGAETT